MQISKETIDILKNFAGVNSNILIRKGKTLATISTAKNIFAKADVAEDFPEEVAVYDLNSLLALLTLALRLLLPQPRYLARLVGRIAGLCRSYPET